MRTRCRALFFVLGVAMMLRPDAVFAREATLAVATNFVTTAQTLADAFKKEQVAHTVRISGASTGSLYAQIVNGAPFDMFLAANNREPQRLEQEGLTLPGTRFTYARGKLVLWSSDPRLLADNGLAVLTAGKFDHVAIANPRTAPYGAAAVSAMQHMGLYERLRPMLVTGENIGQAFHYAASGNAQLAFVALSQTIDASAPGSYWPGSYWPGSYWIVPQDHYAPIEQQAVLLRRASGNSAALGFYDFLKSARAQAIIAAYGYASDKLSTMDGE